MSNLGRKHVYTILILVRYAISMRVGCFRYPDMSEFCVYHNACIVGGEVHVTGDSDYVLADNQAGIKPNQHHFRTSNAPASLPFRSFARIHVTKKNFHTEFRNQTAFVAFFDTDASNPFHFAQKVMIAHLAGHMLGLHPDFALLHRSHLSEWESLLANVLFRNYTIRSSEPVCFQRMIIPGTSIFMFLGTEQAVGFRNVAARALGIRKESCSMRALMVNRHPSQGRRFLNHEELLELTRKRVPTDYLESFSDYSALEQITKVSRARILISTHGAGLTNAIFMRTGGVVLQLFQPHFNYYLYERIAHQSGQRHMFVVSKTASPSSRPCNIELSAKYVNITSSDCLRDAECHWAFKDCNYVIDPTIYDLVLQAAIDMVDIDDECQ